MPNRLAKFQYWLKLCLGTFARPCADKQKPYFKSNYCLSNLRIFNLKQVTMLSRFNETNVHLILCSNVRSCMWS